MMELVLGAMMPANRLALEVSDATGLRIDDVLSLKTETVERTARPYVTDSKTGKRHRIYLPVQLRERLLRQAGSIYVFPGRLDPTKHRTRQAVYKDMMHAVRVFRRCGSIDADRHICPIWSTSVCALLGIWRCCTTSPERQLREVEHQGAQRTTETQVVYLILDQMRTRTSGACCTVPVLTEQSSPVRGVDAVRDVRGGACCEISTFRLLRRFPWHVAPPCSSFADL